MEWVIFLHIDMHMPLALVDLVVLGLIQVVNKYGKGYVPVLLAIWNNSKRLLITCLITCNE